MTIHPAAVLCASLSLFVAAAGARADGLPGLFGTGVDANGTPLPLGAPDPHYTVLSTDAPAYVMTYTPFTYVPNSTTSSWIWETAEGEPTSVERTFRTTFTLTAQQAATHEVSGLWSTDNEGLDVIVNGVSTGQTCPGFDAWAVFTINGGLLVGPNTLDFVVNDFGGISGFRVDMRGGGLAPCGPADIGRAGGEFGFDGVLDNNDFIVFVTAFFTLNPLADRGSAGGLAGLDQQFDNNDFIVFITQFFDGCI